MFSAAEIEAVAMGYVNSTLSIEEVVVRIQADLAQRHPHHILPEVEWVFINAGGMNVVPDDSLPRPTTRVV